MAAKSKQNVKKQKTPQENKEADKRPADQLPVHCTFDEMRSPETLVPNPKNPNKHGDGQIALLAEIIQHRGWRNSIVVSNRSGFIVSGHGRLEAALLLKMSEVPVDLQDFDSEADEWSHMIADNRIAELAEINEVELAGLLEEIGEDVDLRLSGFEVMPEIDEPPQAADVPFSEALMESNNYIVLTFSNDIDWLSAQTHFQLETVASKRQNGKPWSQGIGRVLDGAAYLRSMTKE